ncbi:hypothetical protein F2Q68_00022729 [Brassica cretica]|uniref:MATH domain-containing protein n=1 Tax=Brassica cretica TaxID=69181 RepID=A0A8S9G387_BRACR|nr:hypothetical protein F2Q68_00022729 [Brassica cretica]
MYYNYSLRTFWNFVELSRRGYNDNVLFHRIIKVEIVLEELEEESPSRPMGHESRKFNWVIKNFSSLESEKIYSDQFVSGGSKWHAKFSITIVNQIPGNASRQLESQHLFNCEEFSSFIPLSELNAKNAGFIVNEQVNIDVEVDWLEKKLDEVKEKKEEEQTGEARMQELEEELKDL